MPFRILICAVCLGSGCSGPDSASLRERAEELIRRSQSQFEAGNYQAAFDDVTEAMRSGGVGREKLFEAGRLRVLCAVELRDFDTALADLLMMEEVSASLEDVYALRSFILQKQGKLNAAEAEFRRARVINPKAVRIKG